MNIVWETNSNGVSWKNKKELGDILTESLRGTGYKAERKNFGIITFDEKLLRKSAKYIQSEIEVIAYESIPKVLKKGIQIGEHNNHKERGLDTVTFAAPIKINGTRCNVAVVVKTNKGNRFKVLRIIASDGTKVILDKNKNADPTIGGGLSRKGTHATPIGSASINSISESAEKDNRKFSIGKERDREYMAAVKHGDMEAALEESRKEGDKKGPSEDGEVAYAVGKESVDEKNFISEIDAWNREGRPDSDVFILGSTGDVLQGLGAIENDIYMNASKINNIFKTHPEMTLDEIKKIPQILNDPILILKSRNVGRTGKYNSRIVIFGSVKVKNGKPVLSVLDLRPVEKRLVITDMQKVTSAYTKDNNPVSFVKKSDVLYIDKNKKRAASLLQSIGFQMPIEVQRVGSIGSISYKGRSVNSSGVPFTDIVKTDGKKFAFGKERDREYKAAVERGDMGTAQRMVDQAAKAAGYDTQKLYHGTNKFGFTKIDTSKSKDGISFFATDKPETASTFSGVGGVRQIGKDTKETSGERNGNYQIYANTDNFFEVDAKNNSWTSIPFSDYDEKQRIASTKSIARFAKDNGYAGVKISNVYDNGGKNEELFFGEAEPSTVYIFFDPQAQVKSADAVTYDNKGNVIPLSEWFDVENADIRYSYAKENPKVSAEQREEARNYFVGDIVEINGERGTVMGRQLLKKGDIVYTVELDNGGTVDVSPDELTVGVTTDFFLDGVSARGLIVPGCIPWKIRCS